MKGALCIMGNPPAVQIYSNITMGQPVPDLTVIFVKKEGFKPFLNHREGDCPKNWNWELVPENRGLIAEGPASQAAFRDPRNYQ